MDEGMLDGMEDGMDEGILDGIDDGILDGMEEGMLEGIAEGIADGMLEGMAEGILDGLDEGMAEGGLDGAAAARPAATTIAVAAKFLIVSECQTHESLTSVCKVHWGVTLFIRCDSHCAGAAPAFDFRHRHIGVLDIDEEGTSSLPRKKAVRGIGPARSMTCCVWMARPCVPPLGLAAGSGVLKSPLFPAKLR